MLAVNTDDFTIHVVDVELRRVVRIFTGHHNRVTDMVRANFLMVGMQLGLANPYSCSPRQVCRKLWTVYEMVSCIYAAVTQSVMHCVLAIKCMLHYYTSYKH